VYQENSSLSKQGNLLPARLRSEKGGVKTAKNQTLRTPLPLLPTDPGGLKAKTGNLPETKLVENFLQGSPPPSVLSLPPEQGGWENETSLPPSPHRKTPPPSENRDEEGKEWVKDENRKRGQEEKRKKETTFLPATGSFFQRGETKGCNKKRVEKAKKVTPQNRTRKGKQSVDLPFPQVHKDRTRTHPGKRPSDTKKGSADPIPIMKRLFANFQWFPKKGFPPPF
jgi:hypothetical protein